MENNLFDGVNRVEANVSDEIMAEMFLDQAMKDFKKGKIVEEI
ncbi:phosphoesterase, partial [Priestia megaterium]